MMTPDNYKICGECKHHAINLSGSNFRTATILNSGWCRLVMEAHNQETVNGKILPELYFYRTDFKIPQNCPYLLEHTLQNNQ